MSNRLIAPLDFSGFDVTPEELDALRTSLEAPYPDRLTECLCVYGEVCERCSAEENKPQ